MRKYLYIIAGAVVILVIYSMLAALWLLIRMLAVLALVGLIFWLLNKVDQYYKAKKPP